MGDELPVVIFGASGRNAPGLDRSLHAQSHRFEGEIGKTEQGRRLLLQPIRSRWIDAPQELISILRLALINAISARSRI
jgi:hypothetical protein